MNPQEDDTTNRHGPARWGAPPRRFDRVYRLVAVPFAATMLTGMALIAVGIVGMVLIATDDSPTSRLSSALMRGSADAIIIGVLLLVYVSLRRKGRSIEEAYRLGYDVGFENGYRTGREAREPTGPRDRRRGDRFHSGVDAVLDVDTRVVPMRKRQGTDG